MSTSREIEGFIKRHQFVAIMEPWMVCRKVAIGNQKEKDQKTVIDALVAFLHY